MFNRLKTYIFFFLLLATPTISAQEYRVAKYLLNPESSLLHVHSGVQDQNGFLWFASNAGWYRFNGKKAEKIDFGLGSELNKKVSGNITKSIYVDSKGEIWSAVDKYIIRYNGFEIFKYKIEFKRGGSYIKYIKETDDGSIWFCEDNILCRIKNSKLEDFTKVAGIDDPKIVKKKNRERINNIFLDSDNKLLLATNRGIKKFNGMSFKWVENNQKKFENSNSCLRVNKDTLLLGGNSGILKIYERHNLRTVSLGSDNVIYYIYRDNSGVYWIGTKNGLFELSKNQPRLIETSKDPRAASVLYVFEDNEKNLWACTVQDIFKIKRSDFSKIVSETISNTIGFYGIVEDSKGKLWLSSKQGKIFTYDNGHIGKLPVNLDQSIKIIRDIVINKNDEIWLNTNKGLVKIKDNIATFYPEINGIRTKSISQFKCNSNGDIWFIDSAKNVRIYDGNRIYSPQTPIHDVVFSLIKDKNGTLCLRTKDFILSVDGRNKVNLAEYTKHLDNENPTFIHMDKDGDLWLLTYGKGVFFVNTGKKTVTNITSKDGLLDDRVYPAFTDRNGFIWFGTRTGISRFDAVAFKKTGRKLFENFRNPENEISRLVRMLFQDRKGNIWAATTHGLLKFDIKTVKEEINYIPPKVYITGIKLFLDRFNYSEYSKSTEKYTGMPADMRLPYNKNYLTFNFVGLNLTEPEAVEYQYRLSGFDAAWSPNVKFDEITYTNLPPGKYRFEVKARNKDGQWSVKPASISFEILPPFWKTWWFYSLSFIAMLSVVGAYINIKTRSLKKQKLILERTVEERTMELKSEKMKVEAANQDLEKSRYQLAKINELQEKWLRELSESEQELLESNESKDKLFSLISHDLRSPFRSLMIYSEGMMKRLDEMTPEEIRSYLKNVHKSAENIYKLVEDLLEWSRVHTGRIECNPAVFDVSGVVDEIINVLSANAEKKRISIINNVEENCLVSADKGMINSVINNLISNAIKFTYNGGMIEISAQAAEDTVEISVKDDGVGLSPEDMEKLFKVGSHFHREGTAKEKGTGLGLILCKELIEKNDGNISVISKLGEGSTFIVTLPRNS